MRSRHVEYRFVKSHLPESGFLFDVGSCESPFICELNHLKKYQIIGSDIRTFDQKCSIPFIRMDIRYADCIPNQTFDVITCISTLEHVGLECYNNLNISHYGDFAAMRNIHRILKDDGIILLTVDAGVKGTNWFRTYNKNNLHRITRGFTVEDMDCYIYTLKDLWKPTTLKKVSDKECGHIGRYPVRAHGVICLALRKD